MNVRELMTESPAVCSTDTNLQEVARMMVEHDCGAIPVVEGTDGGKPVGILTDRDITTRIVAAGKNPLEHRAADAMTRNTVTIRSDESMRKAADLMEEHQVRRLIVVDERGACVGILAQADIARHGKDKVTGELVEEISEPGRGDRGYGADSR